MTIISTIILAIGILLTPLGIIIMITIILINNQTSKFDNITPDFDTLYKKLYNNYIYKLKTMKIKAGYSQTKQEVIFLVFVLFVLLLIGAGIIGKNTNILLPLIGCSIIRNCLFHYT